MSQLLHIRRPTTVLRVVLAAASLLAGALASTTASAAVRSPAFTPGSRYLALGDSVPFGFEEATASPAPNYRRAASFLGFPEHIGLLLHGVVANAACPGETSASLIDAKAQSNGCENTVAGPGGYRTAYPLHVRYTGSQLSFALRYLRAHRDTRLVSLMVGANDLFVCQQTEQGCLTPAQQRAVYTDVASNVRRILRSIRRDGYGGQIVLVNYYNLDYSSAFLSEVLRGLNRAIDSAGRAYGAEIADGYGEFLADARRFGGSSCTAGLITRTSASGSCGVHPTWAGSALLAEAVLRAARL